MSESSQSVRVSSLLSPVLLPAMVRSSTILSTLLLLLLAHGALASNEKSGVTAPLECGVASAVFGLNPATAATAVNTGKLSFWWNWNTNIAMDTSTLDDTTVAALRESFVPMVWGTATPTSFDFMTDHSGDVMGFNEPDLYGPACCNCDGKQSYYPATSSGWAPLFNPISAAGAWNTMVDALAAARVTNGTGVRRLVSPAMANGAIPEAGVDCTQDPAVPGNPVRCNGWLSMFKQATLKLQCTDMTGKMTNCWDAIDVLSIHGAPQVYPFLDKVTPL